MLNGQRFLITGATGGAGSAVARRLAEQGANLTVMGRDQERLARLRHDLLGTGHTSLIEGVYNGIFHAAGVELMTPLSMVSRETLLKVFDPSVGIACDLLADVGAKKSILKDGGSIVMMSSVAAVCGTAGMALYAASKGAIEAMCRSAAVELAPRLIRVNCVRAGAFASPMHARITNKLTAGGVTAYADKHPLGFGNTKDIANLAVFLLTEGSEWITGSMLTCDGGFTCQ